MIRFYLQKLVPDKVEHYSVIDPKIKHVEYRTLSNEEHLQELIKKIKEEADEIPLGNTIASNDKVKELADLQIVFDELRTRLGLTAEDVNQAVLKKLDYRGGVSKGHFVEYIDMADDSEWVASYRKQPDKYEEVILP